MPRTALRRARRARPLAATVLLAVLASLAVFAAPVASLPSAVAAAVPGAADEPTTGTVEVPYRGEVELPPARGWSYADCEGTLAASPLVTACAEDGVTLAAPDYDPDLGTVRVPVTLQRGTTTLALDQLATLGPPPAPTVASGDVGVPVAAGSRLLLPVSDLGVECAACGEGARLEAVGVEPASAGRLTATPTHLVFAAAPGVTGEATLGVRVVDAVGTRGETAELTVTTVEPASRLVALHVHAEATAEGVELELGDLVASSAGDVAFLGCGAAVTGTVRCAGDGRATWTPAVGASTLPGRDGAPDDQFSFHVTDASGDQVVGSVTLTGPPAESGVLDGSLVSPAGSARAALGVGVAAPPVASTQVGGETAGLFDPLRAVLDRADPR